MVFLVYLDLFGLFSDRYFMLEQVESLGKFASLRVEKPSKRLEAEGKSQEIKSHYIF